MQVIPLQATPSQTVSVTLGGQACRINIYQRRTGLFLDLYVSDQVVVAGAIAQNANRIVRDAYLGFVGDLAFFDAQGSDDPTYEGLGGQFILAYLEPADL